MDILTDQPWIPPKLQYLTIRSPWPKASIILNSASEKPTKYEFKYPLKASIPDNSLLAVTAVTSLFELTINYLKNSSSVISNPIIFFAAAE